MATESKEFMIHASEGNSNVLDFTPAIDILENDQEVVLLADVPGTTADRVSIDVQHEQLKLVARAEAPDGATIEYRRLFRVGSAISAENITAQLTNGVLTLKLPKGDAYRPRKIAVQSS